MPDAPVATLCRIGVLQRHGKRPARLRVQPRFLAHAEAVSLQMGMHAASASLPDRLAGALAAWPGSPLDPRPAARFLAQFLSERDQLGALRPVFGPVSA